MSRYKFSSLAAGALLLLAGCQSDEFTWNGREVSSDEVMVTLYRPDFDSSFLSTRASDTSDEISELTLVMFNSAGTTLQGCCSFTPTADNWTQAVGSDKIYALTIPYSEVGDKAGKWYFFANADTKVCNACFENKAEGTLKSTFTEEDLKSILYTEEDQWKAATQAKSVLFTEPIVVNAIEPGKPVNSSAAALKHIYGKLNVKINLSNQSLQKNYPLQVTGVALFQTRSKSEDGKVKGDIVGTAATNPSFPSNLSDVSSLDWEVPVGSQLYAGGPSGSASALKKGENLVIRTFPLAAETQDDTYKKLLLVIRGVYAVTDEKGVVTAYENTPVYYAVEVNDGVPANKEWNVTIHGVGSKGGTLADAVANPSGISVVFEDANTNITSMVSDGENALAVNDTVLIPSGGVENFIIRTRAHQKYGVPGTPKVESDDSGYLRMEYYGNKPAWFGLDTPTSSNENNSNSSESKLDWYTLTYKTACQRNYGSEREFKIRFYFDHNKEIITRDVLFIQQSEAGFNPVKNAFDITLSISGAASIDNTDSPLDYSKFVTEQGTYCRGIQPAENGSRIRNEGLHIPMPNDGSVKYTYKLKPSSSLSGSYTLTKSANWPSNAVLTGSMSGTIGTSTEWTVTCTPGSGNNAYDYIVYRDALVLNVGGVEYKLDLYHTGLFHKLSSDDPYCYYEVFSTGANGSGEHWFDRNLGATAAGMASRDTDFISGSVWPLTTDNKARGEYLTLEDAKGKMPAGWTVPGYGNFKAIFSQPLFEVQAITSGNRTFTAPYFRFSPKEKSADGTNITGSDYTIRAYFPCVQYLKNNTVAGAGKAGYYITSTQSSGDYYHVVQFDGLNMSALNQNFSNSTKMTVRPVATTSAENSTAQALQCNVAGYTHVALYAENATGVKTWITTWPGEQIAPSVSASYPNNPTDADKSQLGQTKHFEKIVYYDYGSNLKVIFNTVNKNGAIVASNMVSESSVSSSTPYIGIPNASEIEDLRANRNGITFHNGGTYTREAGYPSNPAAGAKNGNWTKTYTPEATITLQFPRLVKDNKIYDYVEVTSNSGSNIRARLTRAGGITQGRYKATSISNPSNYYQVVLKVPYDDENNVPTPADLKGLIKSHRFYNAATGGNAYGEEVTWSSSSSGVGYAVNNASSEAGNLVVTIWPKENNTVCPEPAELPGMPEYKLVFRALKTATNVHSWLHMWSSSEMKTTGGSTDLLGDWGATGAHTASSSSDNKYYYWTVNVKYQENADADKEPIEYVEGFIFNKDNNTKVEDVNTHSKKVSDTSIISAYGNPDYLYTIWQDGTTEPVETPDPVITYKCSVRGTIFSDGIDKGGGWYEKEMSGSGNEFTLSNVTVKAGDFGIPVYTITNGTSDSGSWYGKNETITSMPYTATCTHNGGNFSLPAGTYTFKFNVDSKELTVTGTISQHEESYDYYIRGNVFSGSWEDKKMTKSGSKYILSNVTCKFGEFGIKVTKEGKTEEEAWYNGDNVIVTLGTSMTAKTGGTNWSLYAGTYTFTFDPSAMTLTVSGSRTSNNNYTSWYVNVRGAFNGNEDNGQQPDNYGVSKHTNLPIGNKGFKVKIWNDSDTWYSTGGAIEQNQWITITDNNDNSSVKYEVVQHRLSC